MNEPIVYSDEQAALLDAHAHACALSQRYNHACDELLDDGKLRDRLKFRHDSLRTLCDTLEARIRKSGMLPHDINVDREDLARLADRFREWLDHERHSHLQRALADREADLLDRLEALHDAGISDDAVKEAHAAGRRMVEMLQKD